jgi:hypothetical protein
MLPLLVHTEDASYAQGEEFEKEFTVEEEQANLDSGLLEIVPREYKNVCTSIVFEHQPGETFTAAIPKGQEELLLGSHIERVDPPAPKSKKSQADKES